METFGGERVESTDIAMLDKIEMGVQYGGRILGLPLLIQPIGAYMRIKHIVLNCGGQALAPSCRSSLVAKL